MLGCAYLGISGYRQIGGLDWNFGDWNPCILRVNAKPLLNQSKPPIQTTYMKADMHLSFPDPVLKQSRIGIPSGRVVPGGFCCGFFVCGVLFWALFFWHPGPLTLNNLTLGVVCVWCVCLCVGVSFCFVCVCVLCVCAGTP